MKKAIQEPPVTIDELFTLIDGLTIREIQVATNGIDLNRISNLYEALSIADALTMKVAGFMASSLPANWGNSQSYIQRCWEYALTADKAYNPDRGY
jgi:hypothetical protein